MTLLTPADFPDRATLHHEIHARPPARIRLPAFVVLVCTLNDDVSVASEWAHIRSLPINPPVLESVENASFYSFKLAQANLRWERHTEFTRYMLIQSLPDSLVEAMQAGKAMTEVENFWSTLAVPHEWLQNIPGQTIQAICLIMLPAEPEAPTSRLPDCQSWFGHLPLSYSAIASKNQPAPHSWAVTDFQIKRDGFEHILVFSQEGMSETRVGRTAQRILDLETYRLMALRGYLVARKLAKPLAEAEEELSQITDHLENAQRGDPQLLQDLISLAAKVEKLMTEHNYRFAATRAYENLMNQRLNEMNERSIAGNHGMLSFGTFLQRRLSPAMATVRSTAERLERLSQRINRNSELLSTRVNISTERNNLELLAKLTRGQALQLQLQSTVEGLSIVAISYYALSIILYAAKALKDLGVPVKPEMVAGLSIPFVLWGTWRLIRKIHHQIGREGEL